MLVLCLYNLQDVDMFYLGAITFFFFIYVCEWVSFYI